jgi:hypothetical protein
MFLRQEGFRLPGAFATSPKVLAGVCLHIGCCTELLGPRGVPGLGTCLPVHVLERFI